MRTHGLSNLSVLIVVLAFLVLASVSVYPGWLNVSPVHAGSEQDFSGFAWSDNVGWISFNCTDIGTCSTSDYGLNLANNGNLSGYVWGDNIGWISFNANNGCPESGCVTQPKLNKSSGTISGWVRACVGTVNGNCTGASRSDGWDGWIKLSGTTPDGTPYGPIYSNDTFTGYSWGSDVVGWLSWGGTGYAVVTAHCTAFLTVSPTTVEQNQNVTLTWSVTRGQSCASTCTGSGFDTGGDISGSVAATVPPSPPSTSYALTCTGGPLAPPPPVNATVTVLTPAVEIKANNQTNNARVNQETANNTTIVWSSTNSTSCSITKNGVAWMSGLSSSGTTDTVTTKTTYTIDCTNSYDTHATASVTVNVLPGFKEF
ncbi:MAG: hypothetical protein Q8P17_01770 [bacterium]|nr:hypothetical protein [bacterium]